ncbi:hypothetical protein BJ165DRAFT_373549 [Panaeolus papilionaceus]|nr:hypothetical protein BJ165DRAFT_373549 [Panaeolus papilionaceus]
MAGSRKRSMDLFKVVSGIDTARNVTIATTMWDQIGLQGREGEERRERAEQRFEELRSGYWEHFTSTGSTLTKSHNTLESSLSILNTAVSQYTADTFSKGRGRQSRQGTGCRGGVWEDFVCGAVGEVGEIGDEGKGSGGGN